MVAARSPATHTFATAIGHADFEHVYRLRLPASELMLLPREIDERNFTLVLTLHFVLFQLEFMVAATSQPVKRSCTTRRADRCAVFGSNERDKRPHLQCSKCFRICMVLFRASYAMKRCVVGDDRERERAIGE